MWPSREQDCPSRRGKYLGAPDNAFACPGSQGMSQSVPSTFSLLCSPREVLFMGARDRQSVYNESRPLSAYEIPARNDIAQLHDAPGPRGMLVPLKRLGIIFFDCPCGRSREVKEGV